MLALLGIQSQDIFPESIVTFVEVGSRQDDGGTLFTPGNV